tara:strand:- start:644 stop:775 length:132 start_codon:yes stop_codon:yes gene_type:complete
MKHIMVQVYVIATKNILVQNQKKALKVITNYRLHVTFVLVMIG